MNWMDLTFKSDAAADVDLLPDRTVELSWGLPEAGSSRLTIIVSEREFRALIEKGAELLKVAVPA